jgi:Rod binding domain-containing protein
MTTTPITFNGITATPPTVAKSHAAGSREVAAEGFAAALDAVGSGSASAADRPVAASSAPLAPLVAHKSRVAPPLEQFEGFVLRSFIESMLPSEASSYFGSGTAGEVWRSMMAEEIGNELAKGGGIGIAASIAADRSSGLEPGVDETELNRMLRDSDVARAGAARHDTTG